MSTATATALAIRPTSFEVESETKPGVTYQVQLPHCSCPDFRYRRSLAGTDPRHASAVDLFCKHLVAAYRLAGWNAPEKTADLTDEQVRALLGPRGVNRHAITVVLAHARTQGGSAVPVDGYDELAVVTYSHSAGLFSVTLP